MKNTYPLNWISRKSPRRNVFFSFKKLHLNCRLQNWRPFCQLKSWCVCLSPLINVAELGYHWFREWLVTCPVPRHYLSQCWSLINHTPMKSLQWNKYRNYPVFIDIVNNSTALCVRVVEGGEEGWCYNTMMTSSNENISALMALCAGNSPLTVNPSHKGQWSGALMFSLIYASINDWVNNRKAGDLRRHRAHYDVTVMLNHITVNNPTAILATNSATKECFASIGVRTIQSPLSSAIEVSIRLPPNRSLR